MPKFLFGNFELRRLNLLFYVNILFFNLRFWIRFSCLFHKITFKFLNLDKPNAIAAELFSHNYIPEYKMAIGHFNNKSGTEAIVYRVSPYAVYLNLFGNKIQAKLPVTPEEKNQLKEGDKMQVVITHLSNTRIVIEPATANQ